MAFGRIGDIFLLKPLCPGNTTSEEVQKMTAKNFGGKPPYDDNSVELGEELTPDPFSDEPQPSKVHLSRMTMRATPGKRGKLHKETPRNNRQF